MIDDVDQMARDLPRMTLHGNIPTATTMALAARVVELLSAMREISASFSNDCEEPTDADILPRHVKAELGKMQEKIDAMQRVLRSISRDWDHEHHSKGSVRAGECDESPLCRVCFANSALTEKP